MLTQKGAALLACLALAAFSSSHAFAPVIGFAPSIQGSFVSSVRVPTLRTARSGRVTPSFSVLTVAAALRNAGMIGKPIPANYKEGEQYTMGGKVWTAAEFSVLTEETMCTEDSVVSWSKAGAAVTFVHLCDLACKWSSLVNLL